MRMLGVDEMDEDEDEVDEMDGVRWVGGGDAALSSGSSCFSQTYKVSQCESKPTSFPADSFCIGFASTSSGFPRLFTISQPLPFSLSGLEVARNRQLWVENGKEIVEQMTLSTFRQLRPAAADKGQSG